MNPVAPRKSIEIVERTDTCCEQFEGHFGEDVTWGGGSAKAMLYIGPWLRFADLLINTDPTSFPL
jgi:hypothetical protein